MDNHDKLRTLTDDDLQCLIEQFIQNKQGELIPAELIQALYINLVGCNVVNNYINACLEGRYEICDVTEYGAPVFKENEFYCPILKEAAAIIKSRSKMN